MQIWLSWHVLCRTGSLEFTEVSLLLHPISGNGYACVQSVFLSLNKYNHILFRKILFSVFLSQFISSFCFEVHFLSNKLIGNFNVTQFCILRDRHTMSNTEVFQLCAYGRQGLRTVAVRFLSWIIFNSVLLEETYFSTKIDQKNK